MKEKVTKIIRIMGCGFLLPGLGLLLMESLPIRFIGTAMVFVGLSLFYIPHYYSR